MADISILPSYHSSILPFFHPSILPSFYTSILRSLCATMEWPFSASVALRMYACARIMRCVRVAAYIIAAFIREPRKICGTSVKIIQLNEYRCKDAPCEKSWKQGNPLSNTIKDTSTIMRNPPYIVQTKGYA